MMMDTINTDDSRLRERFGTRDPFRVPDGYFDTLTANIMAALPQKEEERKTVPLIRRTWVRYAAAAAVACCIALTGYVALVVHQDPSVQEMASTVLQYDDEDVDEAIEYFMFDNGDIASYLTDASY